MRKFKKIITDRYFILSFSFSLITIFFIAAMLHVDYTGRSTLLNDGTPILSFINEGENRFLFINAFGNKKKLDISFISRVLKSIFDFVCIPM